MKEREYISYLVALVFFVWLMISWFQYAISKDISSWNMFELIIKASDFIRR